MLLEDTNKTDHIRVDVSGKKDDSVIHVASVNLM